jgi:hypothetical protein
MELTLKYFEIETTESKFSSKEKNKCVAKNENLMPDKDQKQLYN